MKAIWVIGLYSGQQAKSVQAHADTGIGYFILERSPNGIAAAFRYAGEMPVPSHLQVITDQRKIEKLELMTKERQGTH